MEFIDILSLEERLSKIQSQFNSGKKFRYVMIEDFFLRSKADEILNAYPKISEGKWDGTTYIDQKNKFVKSSFEEESIFNSVFQELNSSEFSSWLEKLTGIENLKADEKLFGAGLHQSIRGAHLNIHVDYNVHPETKLHRRLNVLVYMNKDWKEEYEGYLEFWNRENRTSIQIARYAPSFNRCIIFETNEHSFHGHAKPLNTPEGINRKSLATYYYTTTRPKIELAEEHNSIFINTEGIGGYAKRFKSGVRAFFERIFKT